MVCNQVDGDGWELRQGMTSQQAKSNCPPPPEVNKRVYAFIFAIFTVLAPFGPFIDLY